MKTIKGVLIDVYNEKVEVVEIEKSLKEYYRILKCNTIDITNRKIKNRDFDIICDDEGLFKDPQKISAINNKGEPVLVGNLFVVKFDGVDDSTSLSEDEIQFILDHCMTIYTNHFPKGYPMLTQLEY